MLDAASLTRLSCCSWSPVWVHLILPNGDRSADPFRQSGLPRSVNKKSLFGKPKPDYDIAAHDFENAANCFRSARVYDKAVEALVQAANAQRELQALFMAAKSYESAASLVAQHLNRPADAAQHYRDASRYFLAHGTPERAAEMLEKAAQLMEATSADDAEQLYDAACAMYIDEDKRRFGVDCHKRATGFAIRQHRLAKALAYSRQLTQLMLRIDNLMGFAKQGLISVLILLAMGRVDDAHAQF
ncbi:TPR-like protein, partial [Caulochytrium protostelioides]